MDRRSLLKAIGSLVPLSILSGAGFPVIDKSKRKVPLFNSCYVTIDRLNGTRKTEIVGFIGKYAPFEEVVSRAREYMLYSFEKEPQSPDTQYEWRYGIYTGLLTTTLIKPIT